MSFIFCRTGIERPLRKQSGGLFLGRGRFPCRQRRHIQVQNNSAKTAKDSFSACRRSPKIKDTFWVSFIFLPQGTWTKVSLFTASVASPIKTNNKRPIYRKIGRFRFIFPCAISRSRWAAAPTGSAACMHPESHPSGNTPVLPQRAAFPQE